jgi:membrane protease YdiL (CAAX protease family)
VTETLPPEVTPALAVVGFLQLTLILVGLRVLWVLVLSPSARERNRGPKALAPWEIALTDFVTAGLFVAGTGLIVQIGSALALRSSALPAMIGDPELVMVLGGAMFQIGLLAGAGIAFATVCRRAEPSPTETPPAEAGVLRAGILTFLGAMPFVTAVNLGWQGLLSRANVEAPPQDLVFLMVDAESDLTRAVLIGFAVVIAPLAEEIVFRAGLFRFLRTRVPRAVAYLAPAVIFGALHGSLAAFVPLTALALVFAYSYERTGRIAVPIIAHSLFNLNTVILLFGGVAI